MKKSAYIVGVTAILIFFAVSVSSENLSSDVLQIHQQLQTLRVSLSTNAVTALRIRDGLIMPYGRLDSTNGVFTGGVEYLTPSGDISMGCFTNSGCISSNGPSWWYTSGLISPIPADDYAMAVQGQVKWTASRAWRLMGTAGGLSVSNLIVSFTPSNNFLPLTAGQLKNSVAPFYGCLSSNGLVVPPSWTNAGADDGVLVNVGQVKQAFSFELDGDVDCDGVPDMDELNSEVVEWGAPRRDQIPRPDVLRGVVNLSVSRYHTIALKTDGSIVCWGTNVYGQCSVPAELLGLRCISVAAGDGHSVAVTDGGRVICWGRTNLNLCAVPAQATNVMAVAAGMYSTTALRRNGTVVCWGYQPLLLKPPPSATNLVAISAGLTHMAALRADGRVICWGMGGTSRTNPPVQVTNIIQIACGASHTVALRADGAVICWGLTTQGQCTVPATVTNAVLVAGGSSHTFAYTRDGRVVGWGANNSGQAATFISRATLLAAFGGISNSVAILAPSTSPLNADTDGDGLPDGWLRRYGVERLSPLDDKDSDGFSNIQESVLGTNPYRADTDGDGSGDATDAFPLDSAAWLDTDGDGMPDELHGASTTGLAEDTDDDNDYMPDVWEVLHNLNPKSAADVNADKDEDTLTNYEEYTLGTAPDLSDTDGDGLSDWEELYVFSTNPCLSDTDGDGVNDGSDLFPNDSSAWLDTDGDGKPDELHGASTTGLVEDTDDDNDDMPDVWEVLHNLNPKSAADVNADKDGDYLSNYEEYTLGTAPDSSDTDGDDISDGVEVHGYLLQWGKRFTGYDDTMLPHWSYHLGVIRTLSVSTNCLILLNGNGTVRYFGNNSALQLNFPGNVTGIVAIAVANGHALALRYNGNVVAWGENDCNQSTVPLAVTNVMAIAAGEKHSAVVLTNGAVICWGSNNCGECDVPADVTNAVSIAAGDGFTVVLCSDGSIRSWGRSECSTLPVALLQGGIVEVKATEDHAVARKSDGTVVCWGLNAYGQCDVPSYVTNAVLVTTGSRHSLAALADGRVVGWGSNEYGQCSTTFFSNGVRAVAAMNQCSFVLVSLNPLNGNTDGDGMGDFWDPFPCDPAAWLDTDGDGMPDEIYDASMTGLVEDIDDDNDGMPDMWESVNGLDAKTNDRFSDADGDGVSNGDEFLAGTNPQSADTDGDGLMDSKELWYGLNPLDPSDACADWDGDGLMNFEEIAIGTDLQNSDTDGDGLNDGGEVHGMFYMYGWNPSSPFYADADGDGLNDSLELTNMTNPWSSDTDGDGVSDSDEVLIYGTSPVNSDSDGDMLPDCWEIIHRLNPLSFEDGNSDEDNDGLCNWEEFMWYTDPWNPDSDGDGLPDNEYNVYYTVPSLFDTDNDGMSDKFEVDNQLDPWLLDDAWYDADNDGLYNYEEYCLGTNPRKADTDDDGLNDGEEVNIYELNPIISDCDGDGLLDGEEIQIGASPSNWDTNGDGVSDAETQYGSVQQWGDLQSGIGSYVSRPEHGLGIVTEIAAGVDFMIALRRDGTTVCWGDNSAGQCNIPPAVQTGVVAIAAGYAHGLAVLQNGSVYAWGTNSFGQCSVPPDATNVAMVCGGDTHSVAVRSNGTVVCWGDNAYGQCDVPAGLSGITHVSAGDGFTAALDSLGHVHVWGHSNVTNIPSSCVSGIVELRAGARHLEALKNDGAVVCWGDNAYGQCDVPQSLTNATQVMTIGAGRYHSLAALSDGTIAGWGNNSSGQVSLAPNARPYVLKLAGGNTFSAAFCPGPYFSPNEDSDHDDIPDWYEVYWFESTNVYNQVTDRDATGFSLETKMKIGLDPTQAPSTAVTYSQKIQSLKLFDAFSFGLKNDAFSSSGTIIFERTFPLERMGRWQQYFISSSPNSTGSWYLSNLYLAWSDDKGASGTDYSNYDGSLYLPLSADATSVTIRLCVTGSMASYMSLTAPSLYLITWVPRVLSITGGEQVQYEVTNYVVCSVGTTNIVMLDNSEIPYSNSFSYSAINPFATGSSVGVYQPTESGGSLVFNVPGYYALPEFKQTTASSYSAMARMSTLSDPLSRPWTIACYECGIITEDMGSDIDVSVTSNTVEYTSTYKYPIDSACLRKNYNKGGYTVYYNNGINHIGYYLGISGIKTSGVEGYFEDDDETGELVGYLDFHGKKIEVDRVSHGSSGWSFPVRYVYKGEDTSNVEEDDCECDCCGNGDGIEGDGFGSFAFRVPIGFLRKDVPAGFVSARLVMPAEITPDMFSLSVQPNIDVDVKRTKNNQLVSVKTSTPFSRTVGITAIHGGVLVSVTNSAENALDSAWELTNQPDGRIHVRRFTRAGNVLRDVTYYMSNFQWYRKDNFSQTIEMRQLTGTLTEGSVEDTRPVYLADNMDTNTAPDQFESVVKTRIGNGTNAVQRKTSQISFLIGVSYDCKSNSFWEADNEYNGRPRLTWGTVPWSYSSWDISGRESFRLDQLNGGGTPAELESSKPRVLNDACSIVTQAGLQANVTVYNYEPLEGDSADARDDARPRTEVVSVLKDGNLIPVSKTWHVYVRGVAGGYATLKHTAFRASSLSITSPSLASCAVSSEIKYAPYSSGTPEILDEAPVSSLDEDGIVTSYEYTFGTYDAGTRTFQSSAGGLFLRTVTRRSMGEQAMPTYTAQIQDVLFQNVVFEGEYLSANDTLISWEVHAYDYRNRRVATDYSDGRATTNVYSCCRMLWTSDRDGSKTLRSAMTGQDRFFYAEDEISLTNLTASASRRVTLHYFDGLGRETNTVVLASDLPAGTFSNSTSAAGCLSSGQSTRYTYAKVNGLDCKTEIRPSVVRTVTYSDSTQSSETSISVVFKPDNTLVSSNVVTRYRNGATVTFSSWSGGWSRETRGVDWDSSGNRLETVIAEASDYPSSVTRSVTHYDALNRIVSVTTPLDTTAYTYESNSSRVVALAKTTAEGTQTTAYDYDAYGDQIGTLLQNMVYSSSKTVYETVSGIVWRVTESLSSVNQVTNSLTVTREQVTGLSDQLRERAITVQNNGAVRTTESTFDSLTRLMTQTQRTDEQSPRTSVTYMGYPVAVINDDERVTYGYDGLGRVCYQVKERTDTNLVLSSSSIIYDVMGNAVSNIVVYGEETVSGTAQYDVFGRPLIRTDELGHSVTNQYTYDGHLKSAVGATYPVSYAYDTAGRMTNLTTSLALSGFESFHPNNTCWKYDHITGFLTNKVYSWYSKINYAYTGSGLQTFTRWARGATRTHAYDLLGRIISTVYSNADTPDIAYTYDNAGHLSEVGDGSSTVWQYGYSDVNVVTNESLLADGMIIHAQNMTVDNRQRPLMTALSTTNGVHAAKWRTYDASGRLSSLTFTNSLGRGCGLGYTYDGRYCTGYQMVVPTGGVFRRTVVRDPYRRTLIGSVSHTWNNTALGLRTYNYDVAGRAVSVSDGNAVTNLVEYNARSEVVSTLIGTNRYDYYYDEIGNRSIRTMNDSEGQFAIYWSIGFFEGGADFSYPGNLYDDSAWTEIVEYGGGSDADGNLTLNERGLLQNHAYDCENRLIRSWGTNGAVTYTYDYRHRRTSKIVRDGADNPLRSHTYAYDGWNLILERIAYAGGATDEIEYFWGSDLSGSEQGAGGVGGLVALSINGAFYLPCYDNNGNIIAYVDESGSLAAQFAYDAFGAPLGTWNSELATLFSLRFSTKYLDPETGFYYYGYRYYDPDLGRWLTRDPIGERGGKNLYGFCGNNSVNRVDFLGLSAFSLQWVGNGATYDGRNLWVAVWLWPEEPPTVGYVISNIKFVEAELKDCNGQDISGNLPQNGMSIRTLDRFLKSKFTSSYYPESSHGDDGIHKGMDNGKPGKFQNGIYYVLVNTEIFPDKISRNGLKNCEKGKVVLGFSYNIFAESFGSIDREWNVVDPETQIDNKFASFTNELLHKPFQSNGSPENDGTPIMTGETKITISWDWLNPDNRSAKRVNISPKFPTGLNRLGR